MTSSSWPMIEASPRMITLVVPSPTSSSCVLLSSIILFAAGCATSISLRMALPSLVSRIPPIGSRIIFSIAFGPRQVRITSDTVCVRARSRGEWGARLRLSQHVHEPHKANRWGESDGLQGTKQDHTSSVETHLGGRDIAQLCLPPGRPLRGRVHDKHLLLSCHCRRTQVVPMTVW